MKSIIATLSLIIVIFSCNSGNKNRSETKFIIATLDTIIEIEQPKFNSSKDFVLGKFNYKNDTTFVRVNSAHSAKELFLNTDTYNAFLKMHEAANKDSIALKIISGTRNFEEQKLIWERKWIKYKNLQPLERALKILEYSAMPSSSRHHWGTDMDLNSLNNSYFNSGKGLKEYEWLTQHANTFGFYQVYTDKNNGRSGYNLEKWHWSYLPLASKYLEFYNQNIVANDIKGFEGSELAKELNIIDNYVNGISKKVKTSK